MQSDNSKKCLAQTRNGLPCQTLVVKGRNRCRMHGGAKGSGAPKRNQNALKHGLYSSKAMRRRQEVRGLLKRTAKVLREL